MKFDLIIIGGGLAGLGLAVALRDSGRRIALVENHVPNPVPGWGGRVYAISPASVAFLQAIGCWRHLDATRIAAVEAMDITGDRGGRLSFTAYQSNTEALAWIVESSAMEIELRETVKRQSNVALLCPASPAALCTSDENVLLTLEDGRRIEASLVVGADGRDSWVRVASGLSAVDHPYGELGVVANFNCDRDHGGTAFQWFRSDGVLAWLPLPGKRLSMVWSTPEEHARELLTASPTAFAAEVADAGEYKLGELEAISPPAAFPLRLVTVPETIATRTVLIGDAAHGIHPLSGHGINLGFMDAQELARVLGACPAWRDIGERTVLRRYQRARREEVWLLQRTTHALHEFFGAPWPGMAPLRNFGLSLTDRLPFVKNALVRYAMG